MSALGHGQLHGTIDSREVDDFYRVPGLVANPGWLDFCSTVMTTFPLACPSSRYRIASGTSLNGYVLSITGTTLPASRSSLIKSKSFLFGFAVSMRPIFLLPVIDTHDPRTRTWNK